MMSQHTDKQASQSEANAAEKTQHEDEQVVTESESNQSTASATEIGGPKGLEPTRYGDWESKGRCYDF